MPAQRIAEKNARGRSLLVRLREPMFLGLGFGLVALGLLRIAGGGPKVGGGSRAYEPHLDPSLQDLLSGVDVGSTLGDWTVADGRPPAEGCTRIAVKRQSQRLELEICRKGAKPHLAPASTELYDVYYVVQREKDPSEEGDRTALFSEILERLRSNEKRIAAPEW